jgi:hypothetical protein
VLEAFIGRLEAFPVAIRELRLLVSEEGRLEGEALVDLYAQEQPGQAWPASGSSSGRNPFSPYPAAKAAGQRRERDGAEEKGVAPGGAGAAQKEPPVAPAAAGNGFLNRAGAAAKPDYDYSFPVRE